MTDSKLIKEYLLFAASSLLFNGVKFFVELIAAKRLGPDDYGKWATLILIATYAGNLHFGVLNAIGREIPINMAKGESNLIGEIKSAGLKAVCFTIFLFGFLICIYILLFDHILFLPSSLLLLIIYFAGQQLYQFSQYVFRSELNFDKASIQQGVTAIVLALIAMPCLIKWNLNGLIMGCGVAYLIVDIFFSKNNINYGIKYSLINKKLIKYLIKIGFPILMIGFLYTIITSIDRWIVVTLFGAKEMGYYAFAYNIFSVGLLFLSILATQFYPRLSFAYGSEGEYQVIIILKKQIYVAAIMGTILSLIIICLSPIVILRVMPYYMPSIHIAQVLALGLPFIGIALGISGYFNVISRQIILLIPMAITILTNIIAAILLIKNGYGILGVACATVLSYFIYCNILYYIIYRK